MPPFLIGKPNRSAVLEVTGLTPAFGSHVAIADVSLRWPTGNW